MCCDTGESSFEFKTEACGDDIAQYPPDDSQTTSMFSSSDARVSAFNAQFCQRGLVCLGNPGHCGVFWILEFCFQPDLNPGNRSPAFSAFICFYVKCGLFTVFLFLPLSTVR